MDLQDHVREKPSGPANQPIRNDQSPSGLRAASTPSSRHLDHSPRFFVPSARASNGNGILLGSTALNMGSGPRPKTRPKKKGVAKGLSPNRIRMSAWAGGSAGSVLVTALVIWVDTTFLAFPVAIGIAYAGISTHYLGARRRGPKFAWWTAISVVALGIIILSSAVLLTKADERVTTNVQAATCIVQDVLGIPNSCWTDFFWALGSGILSSAPPAIQWASRQLARLDNLRSTMKLIH